MFKKRVIIAHTDIAAAASRAVFGIEHKVAYRTLDIPELADSKPACVRDQPISVRDQDFDQLQILNCSYEEFSIVVLNTVLSGENCHHVINKIINECTESNVEQVIVAAAIRSDPNRSHQLEGLYENCINLAPDTEYPPLPSDARISDPVLNILLQFLIVEKIPTRCLLVAGHKAAIGTANREDGSLQSIERLQEAVTSVTGLKFSLEISKSLVYKGTNATEDEMSTMIYM
ncbi:uncharacterized protein [Ptychodera flava]|uniref:uncharacterized protein n=1 Tax=Ptychodera flava TaxID=63121 RepID=UPI00396A49A7